MMKKRIIIGLVLLVYLLICIAEASKVCDFDVFLEAAVRLTHGQNIYAPSVIKNLQYFYSPFFAIVLIPFCFNFFITKFFWLLLSGFFLYRIWILVRKNFDTSVFSSKMLVIWEGVSAFFVTKFLLYNLSLVQVTIFLMWAILESLELFENRKTIPGALLLAFAINMKLLPLVALPYLLFRGYYKAFGWVVAFSVFFVFLPALFIGYDFNMFLLSEWWHVINPTNTQYLLEADISSQSLVGTIPVFLMDTMGDMPFRRNIFNLSLPTVELITNCARLALVIFVLYFLKFTPFKKAKDNLFKAWEISYLLLIVPLIFPHQQKYAFLFIFPMVTYLVYYVILMWNFNQTQKFKVFFYLLIPVSIVFSPIIGADVVGRFTYSLVHHYRILGICALLLIVFAAYATPDKIRIVLDRINNDKIHRI
jgi:hypothetical protein